LEQRYLLAGDVAVQLVAGDLVVSGDDADNGFTLQQLVAPDPAGTDGGGGFLITPDATTRLNGLPPGEPWKVDGAVSSIHLDGQANFSWGASNSSVSHLRCAEMYLKLDGSPSSATRSAVSLVDVDSAGRL
jgi:hypothetical protein